MSGAADRRKLRLKNKEARKDKALEDLEKKKLFKSDPLKGFYELAKIGSKYKLGYKEIVAQGLLLLDESTRDKVTGTLESVNIAYPSTLDSVFNEDSYYIVRGKEKNNFFHQHTNSRSETHWALSRAKDETYSETHEDDMDEPVFLPGTNVMGSMSLGSSFSMTNHSFTLSSAGENDKATFGPIKPDEVARDIHTQPDEQRYRAFLLATSGVLAMKA